MKIALTAADNTGLEAKVDPRFGRASYFGIVDLELMEVEFIDNSAANASSGAGIQAAQLLSDQEIETLISVKVGPKAFDALQSAGIDIYTVDGGKLKEVVELYKNENLNKLDNPTNPGHMG
ncbi:NifB/NifX family molybdenum-iron cluster-binding protein [Sporohalobacter salinus]|uniref:NifB/NifX family molybdenum-iron cluster-binding protein n=1 Tax=Sporohalobacter salinus TaxID=1494606 RepID=UPI001960730B|nr:NifB/NifX family molybdenum-iron cluster-binding protein [Sporohalobacter salinus]MBM7622696.1 putative Fe-Mo cluster-binding NifX family protein [Sporohalobacter salinus]